MTPRAIPPAAPRTAAKRANALLLVAGLGLAAVAAAGLLPAAGAVAHPTHTWTCHATLVLADCPAPDDPAHGDTMWFHHHVGTAGRRWATVAEIDRSSTTVGIYELCVPKTPTSAPAQGNGSLTFQAGHTYLLSWSTDPAGASGTACPDGAAPGAAERVPDPRALPRVFVVPGPIGKCVNDPTPDYDSDCVGRHGTRPECSGLQRNDHDDGNGNSHTHYTDVCAEGGDAYVCDGDEWQPHSGAAAGFFLASSPPGRYSELCAGVIDECAGVWRGEGEIDPDTGTRSGTKTWMTDPVCASAT